MSRETRREIKNTRNNNNNPDPVRPGAGRAKVVASGPVVALAIAGRATASSIPGADALRADKTPADGIIYRPVSVRLH